MNPIRTHLRSRTGRRRGAGVLEAMFWVPIAIALVMLTVDLARWSMLVGQMSDVAHTAARAGAVDGGAGTRAVGPSRDAFVAASNRSGLDGRVNGLRLDVLTGGRCQAGNANRYVTVQLSGTLDFQMPGFSALLGLFNDDTVPTNGLRVDEIATVACEIVRT